MELDIVSNSVHLQLLEERYNQVVKGEQSLNVATLLQELEQLERESQYRDFFSLYELGEHRYRVGLTFYRLALATKKPGYYVKALDHFRFVLDSNYRTHTCTTAFLEWLILESPKI